MIAARGFTEAARNTARRAGLDLYTLIDAKEHEWRSYVSIPTLVEDRSLEKFNLRISSTDPSGARIGAQDFRTMPLYRVDGTPIGRVWNLLAGRWNGGKIPREPGLHQGIPLADEDTYILTDGGLCRVSVAANVTVRETLYFGQWPLVEVEGFADELKGGLITRQITTAEINADVWKTWQPVESREAVAGRPAITLCVSDAYHSEDDAKGLAPAPAARR